jgi:bacillopeptidase F (M6 metalloprotease family)
LSEAERFSALAPGADPLLKNNCPGLNGDSGGWKTETFDLTPYAGQTVLLAFRYITDANTRGAGVWVDNVNVGGPSSPTAPRSPGGRRSRRSSRST